MVTRRQDTERNLRGRNSANPLEFSSDFNLGPSAPLSVGGAGNARTVQAPDAGAMSAVMEGLAEFGSRKIREAAAQQYNKQAMDGAMAFQQGEAIENLGGFDKRWQLEGYRQMDAGTSAAALLSAQKKEIEQGLYETDPDAYRKVYADRLGMALEGKDERVQELITKQMMEQMPTLVASHTSQHMDYLERQATSSLETSIDVMSRSPESATEMLAFAKGEAGSAGLSTEARRGAVISGVARAYDNDNPAAWAILEQNGVLGELSSTEQASIRGAQSRFEERRRSEYDEEFFLAEQGIIERISSGEFLDPTDAIDEMAQLYEDRGITLSAGEAAGVFDTTDKNNEVHQSATVVELETAKTQGNYDKMAELTTPYIIHIESRGDRNAVSPTGAKSEMQVMDNTNADPGFGVRPAQDNSLAERARVGRDYWKAMVHRYSGDMEAAGIAYNAGPGRADAFIAAGRDYSALPEGGVRKQAQGYVKQLNALIGGEKYANRASNRIANAKRQAEIVKEANAVDLYAQITPQLADLDSMYTAGDIPEDIWRNARDVMRASYGVEQSVANVNQEVSVHQSAMEAEAARAKAAITDAKTDQEKADAEAYKTNLDMFQSVDIELQGGLETAIKGILEQSDYDENGDLIPENERLRMQRESIETAQTEYIAAQQAAGAELGIKVSDMGIPEATKYIRDTSKDAMEKALDDAEELSNIRVALSRGTLDTRPQGEKDRAWSEFEQSVVTKYANLPPAGSEQEQEARTTAFSQEFQKWFTKSGYVPDEIREQASAALTAQLVDKDGTPSEYAVEAAEEYIALKGKSQHAARQYLSPEAQVVAEAILSITGGRVNTIPQTIQRLHALSGYESTGAAKVDPDFLSRSSVQQAIRTNVSRSKTRGFFASLLGGRGAGILARAGAATPATEAAITTTIEQRVAAIHAVNPNIPPQHIVDMATDSVQQQMAIIGGDLVIDPTGRDIYNDVFGPTASNYRNDPQAIDKAVTAYLRSSDFADFVPVAGLGDYAGLVIESLKAGIPFVDSDVKDTGQFIASARQRVAMGSVEAIGNGRLIVNFMVNRDESPITIPIDLKDVGKFWQKSERARRTK